MSTPSGWNSNIGISDVRMTDRGQLPKEMNARLDASLEPGEEVLFAGRGPRDFMSTKRPAVAITRTRAFGWKHGVLKTYPLADLFDIRWGTVPYRWIHLPRPRAQHLRTERGKPCEPSGRLSPVQGSVRR